MICAGSKDGTGFHVIGVLLMLQDHFERSKKPPNLRVPEIVPYRTLAIKDLVNKIFSPQVWLENMYSDLLSFWTFR
jgi:hypothetical protein